MAVKATAELLCRLQHALTRQRHSSHQPLTHHMHHLHGEPAPSAAQTAHPCVVDWRPASEWRDGKEEVWDGTKPTEVLEIWRDLAAKTQTFSRRRVLARIRGGCEQPRGCFEKLSSSTTRTANTFAERSGAGNAPDVDTGTERKSGNAVTGPSRQVQS